MIGITGGGNIYQIYVDSYFLFHFYINLWILFLTGTFLHERISKGKLLGYSFLAAAGEVLLLCLPGGNGFMKMLLGFLGGSMVLLWMYFRPQTCAKFSKILLSVYGAAILLGGSLLLIHRLFPKAVMSCLWISFLGSGIAVLTFWIIKKAKRNRADPLVEAELFFYDGTTKRVTALIDTGNSLVEPISQKPVSVVEKECVREHRQSFSPKDFRIIPYTSVGNSGGLLEGYFIKKIRIYGRDVPREREHAIIAISEGKITCEKKYQMILHPKLFED